MYYGNIPPLLLSHSVMSSSLRLHDYSTPGLPLSPGVCSKSCPLSEWCYLTISSSAALFSFCLQSCPASGSFPVSWLFSSNGQTIGASALASVFPVNIQGWFPLELIGLILLQFEDYQESHTTQFESINSLTLSVLYGPTVSSIYYYWKNHSFD